MLIQLYFAALLFAAPTPYDVQQMSFGLPRVAPGEVAAAISEAVAADPVPMPLGGSARNEAAIMLTYAWEESAFNVCAVGDHGASLGLFQLQRLPRSLACNPQVAAKIWLARAHESYATCSDLPENERLSAIVSGNCEHGHVLTRHRVGRANPLAELIGLE